MSNLPEKWAICWENPERYEIINNWTQEKFGHSYYYHDEITHSRAYVTSDGHYLGAKSKENVNKNGYEIITFEQFLKYVLTQDEFLTNIL